MRTNRKKQRQELDKYELGENFDESLCCLIYKFIEKQCRENSQQSPTSKANADIRILSEKREKVTGIQDYLMSDFQSTK